VIIEIFHTAESTHSSAKEDTILNFPIMKADAS